MTGVRATATRDAPPPIREALMRLRDDMQPREIRGVSHGEEIVFCEEHEGEYVGWTSRANADQRGYTIATATRALPEWIERIDAVLAELAALEAVADAAWASVTEHPGGPDAPSELRNVRCECLRCSALARLVAVQDQTKEDR